MIENESGYYLENSEKDRMLKKNAYVKFCFKKSLENLRFFKENDLISDFKTSDIIELTKLFFLEIKNKEKVKNNNLAQVCEKIYRFLLQKDKFKLSYLQRYVRSYSNLDNDKKRLVIKMLIEKYPVILTDKQVGNRKVIYLVIKK